MNSTKQLINNEILKKKYSMPCSKETTLSHLLTKNLHFNQLNSINNHISGPLSQRLLKKNENLKVIDDLYKLPKPPNDKKSDFSLEKRSREEKKPENSDFLQSTERKSRLC